MKPKLSYKKQIEAILKREVSITTRGYEIEISSTDGSYNEAYLELKELDGCCGVAEIHNLNINPIPASTVLELAAKVARDRGYSMAIATDITKNKLDPAFLQAKYKKYSSFRNKKTGNMVNVYGMNLRTRKFAEIE